MSKTCALLLLLVFGSSSAQVRTHTVAKHFVPKQTYEAPLPPNPEYVLEQLRVREAGDHCDEAPLVLREEMGRIRERPVILCALDRTSNEWHVVHIGIPMAIPKSYSECMKTAGTSQKQYTCHVPIIVRTDGYCVEHISGGGAARLGVALRLRHPNGECGLALPVYAMSHVRIPGEFPKNSKGIISAAERITYTPTANFAATVEFVAEGIGFVRSQIRMALQHLREKGVMSKAYPEKLLADVIPVEIPLALALIEQWDPVRFRDIPDESFSRIALEYALNREQAFSWSVSFANAVGPLQFTNKNGNGTYAMIARMYPNARISRDFENGTRDMHNVITAAICLLDYELSRSSRAKKVFENDPLLGGIQPVAAYNGGSGAAEKMLTEVERLNKASLAEIDPKAVKLPKALSTSFERAVTKVAPRFHKKKKVVAIRKTLRVNTETPNYIQKYLWVIEYLDKVAQ